MKRVLSAILACAVTAMSAPAVFAKEYPVYDSLTSIFTDDDCYIAAVTET